MSTTFIKQTKSTFTPTALKKLVEVYLGSPFSGTHDEFCYCSAMLKNKQGSLGVEEILCKLLGYTPSAVKHGFDGMNGQGHLMELKPSTLPYPTARYNDVTESKLEDMDTPNNKVVFETHLDGRGVLIVVVDGRKVKEMLAEKYSNRLWEIQHGTTKGSRQSHGINLTAYLERFGAKSATVMFYNPHPELQKSVIQALNLTGPINNLPKL